MPYPALPPELPQILSSPAYEAVRCSRLSDSTNPKSAFAEVLNSGASIRPAPPEAFKPEASTSKTDSSVADSAPKNASTSVNSSCAALLGNTVAKGYLSPGQQSVGQSALPAGSTQAKSISGPTLLKRSPQPSPQTILASSQPVTASTQKDPGKKDSGTQAGGKSSGTQNSGMRSRSPSSYAMSGVSGRLAKTPEAELMDSLDRGILFDGLAESYTALESLSAADLARLGKSKPRRVSQAGDQIPGGLPLPLGTPFPPGGSPPPQPSVPTPAPSPTSSPAPSAPDQPAPTTGTTPLANPANVLEVTADRQDYDERRQIFTAEGKVLMRFRGSLLDADRIQVNLVNRLAVAEGNVALTRSGQVLRGQRFEYNFVQGVGTVQAARGEIFLPSAGNDAAIPAATDATSGTTIARPLSDRITANQPLENVTKRGGFSTSIGAGRNVSRVPGALPRGGEVRRLRFEAEQIDFTPEGWEAKNIQITNDPFSPPELVLKADKATLTRLSPLQDEVRATRPRLVFDQRVAVPLLISRTVLDRRERQPGLVRFGFDSEDRGGLFAEREFELLRTNAVRFRLTPEIYLQRMAFETRDVTDPDNFGARAGLDVQITPKTTLRGSAKLTTLDADKFLDNLRASIRINQQIDTRFGPHRLAFEYSYRDRLFNGSLGFQTVQSSLGFIFVSPDILLGNTGITLNYQAGYSNINANTDRLDLLGINPEDSRVTLGRFQASAGLSRGFTLWQGKALPATREEGLKYTPEPLVPSLYITTGIRGVFGSYTSGDTQGDFIGTVALVGQFGHFSRPFFDYTAFSIGYQQVFGGGSSPFLFDRTVDNRVVSLSLFQQIYGPFRVGIQTSFNPDTSDSISTDYFLEYSRRTHGIIVRYNPVLSIGSIGFRITDFNWTGGTGPFEGSDVIPVEGGVRRTSD